MKIPSSHVVLLALLAGAGSLQAQTNGPFSPETWPTIINSNATVHYVIADPNVSFPQPTASWVPDSLQILSGGDQATAAITIGGHSGVKALGNYLNVADPTYQTWATEGTIDILMQVYGDASLLNADGSSRGFTFLTGALPELNPAGGGSLPTTVKNQQWNWVLLRIVNGVRPSDGGHYVGTVAANAQGAFQNGGVNGGTMRMEGVPNLITRAIAWGPQGAFGEPSQINVFAAAPTCPAEPTSNLAWIDIATGGSNNLAVLNDGDQTVSYQNSVGPAGDLRRAVKAVGSYMNFGIISNYLGYPCNDPRAVKVALDFYDDPALAGTVFGPEAYATDGVGGMAVFPSAQLYTTTGSGKWMKLAFIVPAVDLAGINTTPLTGGPRLVFAAPIFISHFELGIYRVGTNAMAGLDPAPDYFLDPNVCSGTYGNYAELDLQGGTTNGLDLGTSGGDQMYVVEEAGPTNDLRLAVAPAGLYLNFAIVTNALGPSSQDNARLAVVATYYDDPALAGATFGPEVYQSLQAGNLTFAFAPGNSAVTLQGSGQWRNAYYEVPDVRFNGVNQGPQAAARFHMTGPVHITRLRYAVIRPCGPTAGVNLLQALKPVAEFGDLVSGFQDTFTGATRNTNWVALGAGGDHYLQQGGLLKVFTDQGDPNHLVYMASGYSNDVQEVLARIRIVAFGHGDPFRGGIAVGVGTNSEGMNLQFRDFTNEAPVRHFKLLDDKRAWGPGNLTNSWSNNTWYWLRLRQQAKMDGTNTVFAKVWAADWATPEPAQWQLVWSDSALPTPHRTGYAGLTASSNDGLAEYEVSYVLIKAAGLPTIPRVRMGTTPPGMQPPFLIGAAATATNASVSWFGPASLVASESVTGPWTNVVSTTNIYVVPASKQKPAEFFRIEY